MMLFMLLAIAIISTQDSVEQPSVGRSAAEIVRDARVVHLSDALKLKNEKSELVKLSCVYVEHAAVTDTSNGKSNLSDDSAPRLIAYTHAITLDRDRDGKRPVLTLMAKDFDSKTGRIAKPLGTSFSAATVHLGQFPSARIVKNYSTIEELENTFGADRGWTSGWESGDTENCTNSWLVFQLNSDGNIATMSVFARLSRSMSTGRISVKSIGVTEKTFCPFPESRPSSPDENAK